MLWRTRTLWFGLLVLTLTLAAGCGGPDSATVTGDVTYEGQAVDHGMITFLPADGKGPSTGGRIVKGRYKVEKLLPGLKIIKVEAVKAVPFARSSDEMARMAAENKATGDGSGLIDPADVIPVNAQGNNDTVEIKAGKQTHDIHLTMPTTPK